jgi:hypothetical protein
MSAASLLVMYRKKAGVCTAPSARASCLPLALPRVWLPELSWLDWTFPCGTRLVWEVPTAANQQGSVTP